MPTLTRSPSTAIERLGRAIEDALDDAPAADVLTLLTGAFVGLTLELLRRQGHEAAGEIKIDGGKMRDITIHAPKPANPIPLPSES